jgi:hypothetical protein
MSKSKPQAKGSATQESMAIEELDIPDLANQRATLSWRRQNPEFANGIRVVS